LKRKFEVTAAYTVVACSDRTRQIISSVVGNFLGGYIFAQANA